MCEARVTGLVGIAVEEGAREGIGRVDVRRVGRVGRGLVDRLDTNGWRRRAHCEGVRYSM